MDLLPDFRSPGIWRYSTKGSVQLIAAWIRCKMLLMLGKGEQEEGGGRGWGERGGDQWTRYKLNKYKIETRA